MPSSLFHLNHHHVSRICKKPIFSLKIFNFSSSCSLHVLDFQEDSSNHDQTQIHNTPNSYYLELQRKMQSFASSGLCQEALEVLNSMKTVYGKPTVQDYNAMFYYYLKSKHVSVDIVGEVFDWMKVYGPSPNSFTFNTVINGLVSLGLPKCAYYFAEEMCRNGFVPSGAILFRLLKKSLQFRNLILSLDILEVMLKLDYVPLRMTSNLLILHLCNAGNSREAYVVLSALIDKGFSPCWFSYNPILWGLCKSGQSYTALALFSSLKKKGHQLNVCSYTALVHGFSCKNLWEEAFIVLREMQNDNCIPNSITYTILIKYLCDYGEIEKALCVLGMLEKNGCNVDIIPHNIILRVLFQRGKVSEASEVMRVFDEKGLSPDSFTWTAVVGGLLKSGRVSIADELMLSILSNSSFVDVVTCNIYFHILCCTKRSVEAFSLVTSWIEKGFKPNNATYNTILKGFCQEKDLDTALKLFDCFDWVEGQPDPISFNTILSAAGKLRDSSMIRRVLYRMEFENVKLNAVGSTILLQYFCKTGKLSESFKFLDYMIKNGPNPTIVSFNVLLDALCKKGMLGIAYQIFRERTFCPDTTSYNILIYGSLREGNYRLAEQLKLDMLSRNLKPDVVTYRSFIYGFCNVGKITSSLQLLNEMMETGIDPGAFAYNIILYALFQRGRLKDAIFLLKYMVINGCEPDEYTFDILSKAKSRGRNKRYS